MKTDDKLNAMQAGVAVAAGMLIGLASADAGFTKSWLSEYQTLIAGILAIVAAGWTVAEMLRTDERQEQLHREDLERNWFPERLKIERGIRISTSFRIAKENFQEQATRIRGYDDRKPAEIEITNFLEFLDQFVFYMRREEITVLRSFFDGEAAIVFASLERTAQKSIEEGKRYTKRRLAQLTETSFNDFKESCVTRMDKLAATTEDLILHIENMRIQHFADHRPSSP